MKKLLLLPLSAIVLVAAGCGNDVPPNGVAKVGDTTITKASFNHWLGAAAKGQQAPGQTAAATVPDAPKFTKCAAAKAKQPVPKGAQKPTQKQLVDQCKQEYDGLKDQVMQFLVSSEWIQQEADKRDIEATDAEVKKRFADQKKQSFPDDKAYQEFLKTSGQTEADLLFRVKLDVLTNEVRKKVIGDEGKVDDKEIQAYYDKNKARFSQPERRDLLVVLTKTKSQAEAAKKALEKGTAFKAVAKKFSIDDASKAQGGKLPGVAKGQQEKAFDDAIFKAKKGVVTGPVKTQFGFYVFEVTKIVPKSQQTLEQSKETIKNLLKSQGEQKALDSFIKDFQKNYKEETNCAKGFVIQDCKNAPKPKTESTP
ncbi:MAG: peptidyl-prolyl cis-trans isomerase, partial [Thermoleophilaceae bacterium]|nr:peptidyl-prolyl cis-trans isomerase [Thermoleophilaceae bacterium]